MKRTVVLAVAAMIATSASAMTETQKNAAIIEAFLGVAEVRCAVRMPSGVLHAIRDEINPNGYDREANQFRLAEQDKAFLAWKNDPTGFCKYMVESFGPKGVVRPGLLETK